MVEISELYDLSIQQLLAPVQHLLRDETVSEIMINGPKEIFVERGGRILPEPDARFEDDFDLEAAARSVAQFVGKRLTPEELSLEARLPDGSRVHIVQPPAARKGICIAIRKFSRQKLTLQRLVEFDAISPEAAEFLSLVVGMAKNVIVSGGTGSGKTTLLNCLSASIPEQERILVLEDSSELQLDKRHVVSFEVQAPDRHGRGGISIRGLFRAALRMRPDRIVVGECRGGEALDMIQAMTSGHSGSLSTAHANSPRDALSRLETMALMGDVDIPLAALRAQIASAVQVIVQINRFHDGRRRITHIAEVLPLSDGGAYALADLYLLRPVAPGSTITRLQWTGQRPSFAAELALAGLAQQPTLTASLWQNEETNQ